MKKLLLFTMCAFAISIKCSMPGLIIQNQLNCSQKIEGDLCKYLDQRGNHEGKCKKNGTNPIACSKK